MRRTTRTFERGTIDQLLAVVQDARANGGTPVPVNQLPVVQGLAQLHADTVAFMPFAAHDRRTGRPVANQPDIVEQPDPTEDRETTVHKIVQSIWYRGNAWAMLGPDRSTFRVLVPELVSPLQYQVDPLRRLIVDEWLIEGRPVHPDHLLWAKANDNPSYGPLGASPLRECSVALENYGWAYWYLADYFGTGGNPSHVLRSAAALDDLSATEMITRWVKARRQRRPAILDPQWTLEAGSGTNDLNETIGVLMFSVAEVCRATNTPPSIGNAPVAGDSSTYRNLADELRRWIVFSLGTTWCKRVAKIWGPVIDPRLEVRFDTAALLELGADALVDTVATPVRPTLTKVPAAA
jgi:phage portal protein BeeE